MYSPLFLLFSPSFTKKQNLYLIDSPCWIKVNSPPTASYVPLFLSSHYLQPFSILSVFSFIWLFCSQSFLARLSSLPHLSIFFFPSCKRLGLHCSHPIWVHDKKYICSNIYTLLSTYIHSVTSTESETLLWELHLYLETCVSLTLQRLNCIFLFSLKLIELLCVSSISFPAPSLLLPIQTHQSIGITLLENFTLLLSVII